MTITTDLQEIKAEAPAITPLFDNGYESGVYFGMPAEEYHAIKALSSSGIREMMESPMSFWANSWMNPDREREESPAMTLGTAYHMRICEGKETFYKHYAQEFDPSEYPEALRTMDDIRDALRAADAPTNQGKFIDRVVLVETSSDDLTLGAISTALKSTQVSGSGASGDFFITSIKIWGVPTTTAKNYVGAKFHIGTLTVSAGTQADPIVIRDYGTGSRRPGIRCSIPLPSSKLHNFDVLSSTIVAETTGADCIHVTVRQKL